MRFTVLILSLLFALNLHARENWGWIKFNDTDAGAVAPTRAEDADYVPVATEGPGFSIYFLRKSGCFPVIFVSSKQRATGLQLRVDEREVYRPLTITWKESTQDTLPGYLVASFLSANLSEEQRLEYARMARSFLDDASEGRTLRAKLEPSGRVKRWSLRGSKKAIDAAMEYCFAGISDQTYFSK